MRILHPLWPRSWVVCTWPPPWSWGVHSDKVIDSFTMYDPFMHWISPNGLEPCTSSDVVRPGKPCTVVLGFVANFLLHGCSFGYTVNSKITPATIRLIPCAESNSHRGIAQGTTHARHHSLPRSGILPVQCASGRSGSPRVSSRCVGAWAGILLSSCGKAATCQILLTLTVMSQNLRMFPRHLLSFWVAHPSGPLAPSTGRNHSWIDTKHNNLYSLL